MLRRLVDTLGGMETEMGKKGMLERAAIWEMGRVVADKVFKVNNEVCFVSNILTP